MVSKKEYAVSLAMFTKQQIADIHFYAETFGFTVPALMRFATLKIIEQDFRSLKVSPDLEKRKKIADVREKAGFTRVVDPHSNISRGFGSNTPPRSE